MLQLRPSCECCDKDLPPSASDAMICTFECTFCRDCVESRLHGVWRRWRKIRRRRNACSIRKAAARPSRGRV
jgi:hypothetical protein